MLRIREGDISKELPVSAKVGRLRFEEAAADVLNDYRTNDKRSLDVAERRITKHLMPYFAARKMASLTTSDIRAYVAHRNTQTTVTRKAHDEGRPLIQVPEQERTNGRSVMPLRVRADGRDRPWWGERPKPIRAFTKAWKVACRAAGCPGRIPHDLRRTAVRNMVRRGVPERVAMQLTGHKTRSIFERHNIVSDGDLRTAAQQLAGLT